MFKESEKQFEVEVETKMKPKAIKSYETILVVEGRGHFPIDMLRYDSCFPRTGEDAGKISRITKVPFQLSYQREIQSIVLIRRSLNNLPATTERWESFGWRVVSETSS